MAGEIHDLLVEMSGRWLLRQRFGVVATELSVLGVGEEADAIGFRSACSAIVEAKASRADFLADRKKPHRADGGLGVYRFYLCPEGIITVDDLPPGWGLLYACGRAVKEVVRPRGNLWPSYGSSSEEWARFQHQRDEHAEFRVMYSIARRRSLSRSESRYEEQADGARRENARLARHNDELAARVKQLELQLAAQNKTGAAEQPRAAIRRKAS